jgi:hypothetical protein
MKAKFLYPLCLVLLASLASACGSSESVSQPRDSNPEKTPLNENPQDKNSGLEGIAPVAFIQVKKVDGTNNSCMGFLLKTGEFYTSGHCLRMAGNEFVLPEDVSLVWGKVEEDGSLSSSQFRSQVKKINSSFDSNDVQNTDFAKLTIEGEKPSSSLFLQSAKESQLKQSLLYWRHFPGDTAKGSYGYNIGGRLSHNGLSSTGTSGSPVFAQGSLPSTGPTSKQQALDLLSQGQVIGLHFGILGGFSFALDA